MRLQTYKVSFRVRSPSMDPLEISDGLNMQPKWAHKVGAIRTTPKGKRLEGVYDETYCSFPIPHLDGEYLSDLLARTASELQGKSEVLDEVFRSGGSCEFYIGWFSSGNTGEQLPSELLKQLGDLHIDLAIDVYCEEDAPEVDPPP